MGRLDDMKRSIEAQKPPAPPPTNTQRKTARKHGKVLFACGCAVLVRQMETGSCATCAKQNRIARAKKMNRRPPPPRQVFERLPVGSRKSLYWNGAEWTGTLTFGDNPVEFTASGPTELSCLHALHAEYLKWKHSRPKTV